MQVTHDKTHNSSMLIIFISHFTQKKRKKKIQPTNLMILFSKYTLYKEKEECGFHIQPRDGTKVTLFVAHWENRMLYKNGSLATTWPFVDN